MALARCQLVRLAADPREQSLLPPLRLCRSPPLRLSHGTGSQRSVLLPPLRQAADPREQSLSPPQRSLPRMLLCLRLLLLFVQWASPESWMLLPLPRLPPSLLLALHLPILLLDAQRPGTHTRSAVLGAASCPRVSSLRLIVWVGKGGIGASDSMARMQDEPGGHNLNLHPRSHSLASG
jgi:hypothetical protein